MILLKLLTLLAMRLMYFVYTADTTTVLGAIILLILLALAVFAYGRNMIEYYGGGCWAIMILWASIVLNCLALALGIILGAKLLGDM